MRSLLPLLVVGPLLLVGMVSADSASFSASSSSCQSHAGISLPSSVCSTTIEGTIVTDICSASTCPFQLSVSATGRSTLPELLRTRIYDVSYFGGERLCWASGIGMSTCTADRRLSIEAIPGQSGSLGLLALSGGGVGSDLSVGAWSSHVYSFTRICNPGAGQRGVIGDDNAC